jgi:signal transduction histidine kinase
MPRHQYIRYRRIFVQCLSGGLAVSLITLLSFWLGFNLATTACLYLLIVVLLSLEGSFLSSAVVSLLAVGCLAYYFAPPLFSLRVSDPLNVVAITVFFTTSAVITHLVSKLRKSEEQEFNLRLEERVSERTRIARELHETLLHRVDGLISRLQAVDELLPARPGQAKQALERALGDADQTITEARDAVHELRSSTAVTYDLASAVTALGAKLGVQHEDVSASEDSTKFLVEVQGTPQDLHPILRDEIYRIAASVLRSAFHARARRIEVEFRYDRRQLRVLIRDDGNGVPPSGLSHERLADHRGMSGLRERARQIGVQMDFCSEMGADTEVELRIPASIAYRKHDGRIFRWFG